MPHVKLDAIDAALTSFEAALTPDAPADMGGFVQGRVRLAKAVNLFLAEERDRLNEVERLGFSAPDQATQQRIYKTLLDLRMRYSDHIARWDNRTIAADWHRYHADSADLVAGLRAILAARQPARRLAAA